MVEIKHVVSSTFKTFDYHSFRVEGNHTFKIDRDLEAIKLMGERLGIDPVDSDGVVDLFKVDRIIREFTMGSFLKQKAKADKLPKETFGLAQFEGETWVAD